MDDDTLSARLGEPGGLDAAFEALVRGHQDRLFSIALRILGDPRDAEEIAQDAFVRAYRALAGYQPAARRAVALRPWLAAIVVNLARNRARLRGRRTPIVAIDDRPGAVPPSTIEDGSGGPDVEVGRRLERERLAGLVAALPERYRVAVVLRHVDGLAYPQISEALGVPEGTVKARAHRGLALLRAAHDADDRRAARPGDPTAGRPADASRDSPARAPKKSPTDAPLPGPAPAASPQAGASKLPLEEVLP